MDQLKELMYALPMTNAERQWVTRQIVSCLSRNTTNCGLLSSGGSPFTACWENRGMNCLQRS